MYAGAYCGGYGSKAGYSSGYSANLSESHYVSGDYHNSSIDTLVESAPQNLTISNEDKTIRVDYANGLYLANKSKNYFAVDNFLTHAQETEFVDDARLIEQLCKEAFRQTAGKELPKNISINLCSEEELKKAHLQNNGKWNAGIQGFSINRGLKGVSEIFVKKDFLDKVMLTLGHEIGHVLSPSLADARDEEAKAFAFSIAWMRTIVDNNIAGLANAINLEPAKNGIHDTGFNFVKEIMQEQKTSAFDVFMQLANGLISLTKKLEQIIIS